MALMCGSEGLLGVVTEITVRLLPNPPGKLVLLAAFRSLADAGQAVTDIIRQGIVPAGLEMMDELAIQATEGFRAGRLSPGCGGHPAVRTRWRRG